MGGKGKREVVLGSMDQVVEAVRDRYCRIAEGTLSGCGCGSETLGEESGETRVGLAVGYREHMGCETLFHNTRFERRPHLSLPDTSESIGYVKTLWRLRLVSTQFEKRRRTRS
ncbi:MAG: hypothetical protein ACE5MG_11575 [Candidatus Methylomirabilales bacterium]